MCLCTFLRCTENEWAYGRPGQELTEVEAQDSNWRKKSLYSLSTTSICITSVKKPMIDPTHSLPCPLQAKALSRTRQANTGKSDGGKLNVRGNEVTNDIPRLLCLAENYRQTSICPYQTAAEMWDPEYTVSKENYFVLFLEHTRTCSGVEDNRASLPTHVVQSQWNLMCQLYCTQC